MKRGQLTVEANSTQKKIEAEIHKIAKKHGLDADFEYHFSNSASIFFRDGFDTFASASVEFSNDHVTFAFAKGERKAEYFGHNDKTAYVHYSQSAEMKSMLQYLDKALGEVAPKAKPKKSAKKTAKGSTLDREQVVAELEKVGIKVVDGKIRKSDIRKALAKIGKSAGDIDPDMKKEFLGALHEAFLNMHNLLPMIWQLQGIAKKHDPSGLEKKGLLEVGELLDKVRSKLQEIERDCKEDRKK